MRHIAIALLLLFGATPLAVADEMAASVARHKIAREIVELIGVPTQFAQLQDLLSQQAEDLSTRPTPLQDATTTAPMSERFAAAYTADMPAALDEVATAYAARFSLVELQEIRAFYQSGAGSKFVAQSPALVEATTQIAMAHGQRLFDALSR